MTRSEDEGSPGQPWITRYAEDGIGSPVETRSSSIYRSIHQAVVEQRLAPGTKLSEDQIGGLFGASRTLVRAALHRLAHDGIVTISRNRGAYVASPTIEEARQVFEARRIIETVTVRQAAATTGPRELVSLEKVLAEGADAVARGDRGMAIRLSGDFHLAIATVAGQRVLFGFLTELVSRSSLVIALYGRGQRSTCGDAEHAGLLSALRDGASDKAVGLMIEHLHHIEADLDLERHGAPPKTLADALGPFRRI